MAVNLDDLIFEEPQQESMGGAIGRNISRSTLKGVEAIGGFPGDIAEFANVIAQQPQGPSLLPQPTRQYGVGVNQLLGQALPKATQAVSNVLPTQESLHEKATKYIAPHLPEKYLEPQGEWEKLGDEFISTLAPSLVFGAPKTIKGVGKLATSVATGLGSKEIAKKFGFGQFGQSIAQFGGALLPGILGNAAKVKEKVTENYKLAEEAGKGQYLNGENLWHFTEEELGKLVKGQPLPYKKEAAEQLNGLKTVFHGADRRIPVNEAVDRVQEFNKIGHDTRNFSKEARDVFKRTAEKIDDSIMNYGKQHKQFGMPYELAKTGYRGLNARTAVEDAIKEWFPVANINSKLGQTAYHVLTSGGSFLFKGLTGLAKTATVASSVAAVREGDKLIRLLKHSKLARDIYMDSIKNAANGNKAAFLKDAKNFDLIAQHFEKQDKKKNASIEDELVFA